MKQVERERKKIKQVANEYRSKGYEVVIEPTSNDLPHFLSGYRPDIIALSDKENVVIEIKSSAKLAYSDYLTDLAKAIINHPNWRFEFVMTNPRDISESEDWGNLLSEDDIHTRIEDARKFLKTDQIDSSLLILWTAIEAVLRHISIDHDISTQNQDIRFIVKYLYSLGEIDENIRSRLDEAAQARNSIVHGYKSKGYTRTKLENLLEIADELLSSQSL